MSKVCFLSFPQPFAERHGIKSLAILVGLSCVVITCWKNWKHVQRFRITHIHVHMYKSKEVKKDGPDWLQTWRENRKDFWAKRKTISSNSKGQVYEKQKHSAASATSP